MRGSQRAHVNLSPPLHGIASLRYLHLPVATTLASIILLLCPTIIIIIEAPTDPGTGSVACHLIAADKLHWATSNFIAVISHSPGVRSSTQLRVGRVPTAFPHPLPPPPCAHFIT